MNFYRYYFLKKLTVQLSIKKGNRDFSSLSTLLGQRLGVVRLWASHQRNKITGKLFPHSISSPQIWQGRDNIFCRRNNTIYPLRDLEERYMQRTIVYRISWIINKCIICFIRKYNPVSPTCLLYKLYKIFFLHKRTTNLRHIISVSGFHYSGSSAVIGLLSEYSNIDILGDSDTIYSKSIRHKYLSEVVFFFRFKFV